MRFGECPSASSPTVSALERIFRLGLQRHTRERQGLTAHLDRSTPKLGSSRRPPIGSGFLLSASPASGSAKCSGHRHLLEIESPPQGSRCSPWCSGAVVSGSGGTRTRRASQSKTSRARPRRLTSAIRNSTARRGCSRMRQLRPNWRKGQTSQTAGKDARKPHGAPQWPRRSSSRWAYPTSSLFPLQTDRDGGRAAPTARTGSKRLPRPQPADLRPSRHPREGG